MSDRAAPLAWVRVTIQSLRTATTVAGLTLLVGFGAINVVAEPAPDGPAESAGMAAGPLDDLMQQNRCSFTGFDRHVVPSKAIVRTPAGETELVSFDHGWDVFSGKVAGELVAVCLGPEPAPVKHRSPRHR